MLYVADIAGAISSPEMYNVRVVKVTRGRRIMRDLKSLQINIVLYVY